MATLIGYGPNAAQKYVTIWFRNKFKVADPTKLQWVKLRLRRDDGCIVRLNGVEIQRLNLPQGPVGPTTLAGVALSAGMESNWVTTYVNPAGTVAGENVFSVEVHQAAVTSPDLIFEAELTGMAMQGP